MSYCLGCQTWTENLNPQIHVCSNQRLRESSICKKCGANKSTFLREDVWKACVLAHRVNTVDHSIPNHQRQRQRDIASYPTYDRKQQERNNVPTPRQIFMAKDREFQECVERNITHQWNIDHVPGYYERCKQEK